MNYYQYKRRAPRKSLIDYLKPFLVLLIFFGILYAGWRLLGNLFLEEGPDLSSEKVFVEIEAGSAKAQTASEEVWKNIPTDIYFYEGERVKTQSDGRLTLTFFDENVARLDKSTEVAFSKLQREGARSQVGLELEEGKMWLDIDNSPADYEVKTDLLVAKTSDASFSVSYPGMVYVIDGRVEVDLMDGRDVIKSVSVGVGQQLIVDEAVIADLAEGLDKEIIFALDDSFKTSNWYRWNSQQGGLEEGTMEDEDTLMEEDDDSDTLSDDTETEAQDEEPVDPNDKEPPTVPEIEEPGNNGDTVTIDDTEQIISGSVSSDTYAVIVNDYRLSRYEPGSKTFRYVANVDFDNLEVGENEYEVIAEDRAGNQSEAATLTLVLPQEVFDEKAAQEEEEETDSSGTQTETTAASSSGGVTITAPNNGENLQTSETSFEIKGDVPEGTAKVLVNGYQLQAFEAGDSSFLYRANSTLGTLEIGTLNTYTVKAYDEDDKLLGEATMTIDVEASETGNGDPVITMPSSEATYSTTLDQLAIGGTVGKWVESMYVNGQKLTDYIPGSEEWSLTVNLTPGENVFSVYGEKGGDQTATARITIQYQN